MEPVDYYPSLVGYWRFDEGSGANTYDSSGHGNNGTSTNAAWLTSNCIEGDCLSFNGTNSYVNAGNASNLNITSAITIYAWLYSPMWTNAQVPISKGQANASGWYIQYLTGGNLTFVDNQSGASEVQYTLPGITTDGVWMNVAFTKSGTTGKWYINGVDKTGTHVNLADMASSANNMTFGAYSQLTTWFTGNIDDVRIYNKTLTPSQIQAIYNAKQ